MGEALENYIKDLFAGTLAEDNEQRRMERLGQTFSYQGNQNNPPDLIIRQGDAIEVKKIETVGATLALNSSYPKAKLYADSPMLTQACRACEQWGEKDIIYAVGVVNQDRLSKLFFVYGMDYAASAEVYERIKSLIRDGVNETYGLEFAETRELGRVNRVDPLGITYLRIRGMWGIENPARGFAYLCPTTDARFECTAIINAEKYQSFPNADKAALENINSTSFHIEDVKIKNPNNPSVLRQAKLITYRL